MTLASWLKRLREIPQAESDDPILPSFGGQSGYVGDPREGLDELGVFDERDPSLPPPGATQRSPFA